MSAALPALRDARPADLPRIVALNDSEIPHVNALDPAVWRFLADEARMRVADAPDGTLAALLVALPPGRAYGSQNYAWFQRRLADFLYVDRIIVAAGWRGVGLGAALYRDIGGLTRAPIVCDVNLRPSNDASLAFHGRQGFREIGVQSVYGDTKRVALMARRSDGVAEPSLLGPDDGAALRCVRGADGSLAIRAEDSAGVVMGMASLHATGAGMAELRALRVAEALRGWGLGARLVAASRREAMGQGWRTLEIAMPPTEPALRFLTRNGFAPAGGRLRLVLR